MRSIRHLLMVLLVLALAAAKPVWPADDSAGSAGNTVAIEQVAPEHNAELGGRGEGFEEKDEKVKEEIPTTFGPIITDTAIPIEDGRLAIQPTFGLSFATNSFTSGWQRESAGGDFQSLNMNVRLTYGLIDNLEVYTVIPYIHNWASDVEFPGQSGERAASAGGLGDVSLTFKYRVVEETDMLPTVSAIYTQTFPSGAFRNLNPDRLRTDLIGGGAFVFTPGLNVSKYVKPFIFYGNFWYSMQTSFTNDNGKQYPGDFLTVNLAAEYPMTKKWVALLELTSYWGGGRLFGPETNVPQQSLVSIIPGIEFMATDKFSLALGLSVDLAGKNINGTIMPLLSMIYAF